MGDDIGNPAFIEEISGELNVENLKRISDFNEEYIQDLIEENPELIPEIDHLEEFFPLIPVGYEVTLSDGSRMDLLFVSPSGYFTIVETKLYGNPEIRRKVISQILDYGKELHKMGFEEIDQKVRNYRSNNGIIETIFDSTEANLKKSELHDQVRKNLRQGRILLLIVGDGIREGTKELKNLVNEYPQLSFNLALVELRVYRNEKNDQQIVVPYVPMQTKRIRRAEFKINERQIKKDIEVNEEDYSINVNINPLVEFLTETEETDDDSILSEKEFYEECSNHPKVEKRKIKDFIEEVKQLDPEGINLRFSPTQLICDLYVQGETVKQIFNIKPDGSLKILGFELKSTQLPNAFEGKVEDPEELAVELTDEYKHAVYTDLCGYSPEQRDRKSWWQRLSYEDWINKREDIVPEIEKFCEKIEENLNIRT